MAVASKQLGARTTVHNERIEKMKVEYLDPDWTCFIRCPHCPARSFACCEDHAVEEMHDHLSESHDSQ